MHAEPRQINRSTNIKKKLVEKSFRKKKLISTFEERVSFKMSRTQEEQDRAVSADLNDLHALLGAHASKFLKEVFPEETERYIFDFIYVNHPEELPKRRTAKEIPFGLGDTYTYIKRVKRHHKRRKSARKAKK